MSEGVSALIIVWIILIAMFLFADSKDLDCRANMWDRKAEKCTEAAPSPSENAKEKGNG